jgi:hypothetical protein
MHPRTWAAWLGTAALAASPIAWAQGTEERVEKTAREAQRRTKSAADELGDERRAADRRMGRVEDGDVKHTVTLDLAGVATGDGINGQYLRSIRPKLSTVLGGNYSRTDGVGGAITKFGAEAGLDYFLIGRHNEGLRIGPRVVGSVGVDTTGGSAGFGDIGAGAELGYNFISRMGITAGAAAGWDLLFKGRLGGNSEGDVDGHPYGKLNVGYSW